VLRGDPIGQVGGCEASDHDRPRDCAGSKETESDPERLRAVTKGCDDRGKRSRQRTACDEGDK
jgi:hypothetical protein